MKRLGKKFYLGVALTLVTAMTLGGVTYSRYVQFFKSESNTVKAKKFVVSTNGTLDGNSKFNFEAAPGDSGKYDFVIDKSGVDSSIPVQYTISFTTDGDNESSLFHGNSPIELNLYRYCQTTSYSDTNTTIGNAPVLVEKNANKCEWTVYPTGYAGNPNQDYYKLDWKWNENDDNDINYQGKIGNITITIKAAQMYQTVMKASVSYTKSWLNPITGKTMYDKENYKNQSKDVLLNKDKTAGKTIVIKNFLRGCDYTFALEKVNDKLIVRSITCGDNFDDTAFNVSYFGSSIELENDSKTIDIYITGDYDTIANWYK